MTSEIGNLEKGLVVSTMEYDANKRIIGIGTQTITPNPVTGIAPLSKQGAFTTAVQNNNISQNVGEILGNNFEQSIPVQNSTMAGQPQPFAAIPTPSLNDSITTNSVNVEIPGTLGNLSTVNDVTDPIRSSFSEIAKSMPTPVQQTPQMPIGAVPVSEPVAPQQEVLATEPLNVNDQLFANPGLPTMETMTPINEPVQPTMQNTTNFATEENTINPVENNIFAEQQNSFANNTYDINSQTSTMQAPPQIAVDKQESSKVVLGEEEQKEIAKKLASIVSEATYKASYDEFLGLLKEMSKEQHEEKREETHEMNIDDSNTLFNPMLDNNRENTMRMVA